MKIIVLGYIRYPWFDDGIVRDKKLIKIEYPQFLIFKNVRLFFNTLLSCTYDQPNSLHTFQK